MNHQGRRNAKQVVKTCINLHDAQSKGSNNTRNSGEHRQYVDGLSRPSVDSLFTDKGFKYGADKARFSLAELEIGKTQSNDAVVCPRMKSPVHIAGTYGKVCGSFRTGLNSGNRV